MAEADHIKLSRKDLREPDEFQALTAQATDWLRQNQSAVVGGVSALAAVVALVLGITWYSSRQAESAAARFQTAHLLYQTGKFADAATEFQAVAAAYPRAPMGRIAVLYRAHSLLQQPDAAAAALAYGEYLAGSPATEYLRQEALVGSGRAQEASKNDGAALDAYRQAADIAGPFHTQALSAEARLEDAGGNGEKAKTLYTELLKAPDLDAATRQAILAKLPPGQAPAEATPQAVGDAADDDAE